MPDAVRTGPDAVVAAFLRGYYLGDGSFSDGTVEITTASEGMASDLTYLLARLGVLFRVRRRDVGSGATRITVAGADELAVLADAFGGGSEPHEKVRSVETYAAETVGNTNVDTVPVGVETMLEVAEAASYAEFADAGVETHNYTGLGQRPGRETFDDIADVLADGGSTV